VLGSGKYKKLNNSANETHLFVFFQVASPGKRLVAVLACVRVGVSGVRCGCNSGDGSSGSGAGSGVRRRTAVAIASVVDRGTGPAVARGAAVRRRVVLRHGRAPRRSCLFGARLARATQCFCGKS